jgi:hypothetical protein
MARTATLAALPRPRTAAGQYRPYPRPRYAFVDNNLMRRYLCRNASAPAIRHVFCEGG